VGKILSGDADLKETIETVKKEIMDLRKDLDSRLLEIQLARAYQLPKPIDDLQKDARRQMERAVSERPFLALGVAFTVGIAFGIVLSASRARI